jgi:hypothetical protein
MNRVTSVFLAPNFLYVGIEHVYNNLQFCLNAMVLYLLLQSRGPFLLLKNNLFLLKNRIHAIHITSHNHQLWFPFKTILFTVDSNLSATSRY